MTAISAANMSVMDYGLSRRYAPHGGTSFPDYYCDERSTPFSMPHAVRTDPRGIHYGDLVGGNRSRFDSERDDNSFDGGASRRRIAVACARCRKRKIRCSGDSGNGAGCSNCRQAGVDASSCQFHRVGSDNVHKVIDNYNLVQSLTGMANSNGTVPLYSTPAHEPVYSRSAPSQTYSPVDSKPLYLPTWPVSYADDTPPVEAYGLEQQPSYLSNNAPVPNSNLYDSSYRWTYPSSRPLQQATNAYYGQHPYLGIQYTPNKSRAAVASEPLSPMNMSSLGLTLPSRPHRRYRAPDGVARQLPFPQPNPAQTSRNAVDNQQDRRLRSSQGSSTSFMRPPQLWNPNNDSFATSAPAASTDSSAPISVAPEGALNFLATAAIEGDAGATGTTASPELNFSTSTLLEAMTASAPSNKYSNFRESGPQARKSGQITRQDSHSNLYSYTDNSLTRNTLGDESSDDCKLVNGRQYVPLAHQQIQGSSMPDSMQRDSFQSLSRPMPLAPMRILNTSF